MSRLSVARRHRGLLAASTVVVLGAGALIGYAVTSRGYTVRHEDLNDGGVWVTNSSEGLTGRLNKPIGQLDAGFYPPGGAQQAYSVDISQDGASVLAFDRGSGRLYPVDVRAGTPVASQGISVAADDDVQLDGGSAAVLDPASGKVWAVRMPPGDTSAVAKLDSSQSPTVTVGPRAALAVAGDGTVYAASAQNGQLTTLRPTDTGFATAVRTPLVAPVKSLRLTAVGDSPVVLNLDTGAVSVPGRGALAAVPADPAAVLQQPGPEASDVLLATTSSWLSVPLAGGPAVTLYRGGAGQPARPVRLGACAHAAWGGQPGRYARTCAGAPVTAQPIPSTGKVSQPAFRVNRDQIVLNDLTSGGVWEVDSAVREIDDWQAVRPPKPLPKNNNPNQQDKSVHPSAEDRPPVPKPDTLGARPGRTTVLHVLDNDGDPDGDILSISAVTDLDSPSSPVSITADGQAVQIALDPTARADVHFRYTVDDGKGLSASTDVTVQPRAPGENEAPKLRAGFVARTWTVTAGGTFSYPVLGDWRDFDGDPLVVSSATAPAGTIAVGDDGLLTFVAPTAPGSQQLTYAVSDAIAPPVAGTLTVNVLSPNSTDAVAATAEPDVARAIVGRPVTISPLANDIPGSDPTDSTTRMQLAAPVAQPATATVGTDLAAGTVTVTPKRPGTTLLKYQVSFGSAKLASGVIRVDAVAEPIRPLPPVAVPDTVVLRGQQPATVDVLANDYDPGGNVLVVQRALADADAGLQIAVIQGHWLRVWSTQPDTGGVRLVRYTITDGLTGPVTGQLAVTQFPADQTPLPPLPADDTATVRAGDSVQVPVLDNDIDPTGEALTLKAVRSGSLREGQLTTTPALGAAFLAGSAVRFEAPTTVANQTQVQIDYVVADTSGLSAVGHLIVTITPAPTPAMQDQPPTPVDIVRSVVAGDTLVVVVPTTMVDPDGDSVTVTGLAGAPTLGRVTATGPTSITYESYPESAGTDTFAYTVTDRYGLTGTAQLRIGVVPPGDPQPPVAVDDQITAAPGSTVHVAVLANDLTAADDTVSVLPLSTVNNPVPAGVSLTGASIVLTAPPADGKPLVVSYAIVGGSGVQSTARVIVSSQDGYDIPPTARDDVARATPGATTVTVDALANDDDADGGTDALRIAQVYLPGATATGGRVTIPLQAHPQTVGYQVVDAGGAQAVGWIYVPGNGPAPIGLRADASTVQMSANSTKAIDLADYVTGPAGKRLRLTTTQQIWAAPGSGLTATSRDATTLALTSRGNYTGPASTVVQVTDSADLADPAAQRAIVSIPVQIGKPQPVLRCPDISLTALQGGPPVKIDLLSVCHIWVPTGSPDQLNFTVAWTKRAAGVDLAKTGNAGLTLTPTAQAHAGNTGTISLTVPGTSAQALVNVRVIAPPPPTFAPITVQGLRAGQSQTLDVRSYVRTPIQGATVSVVSVAPATQAGVSLAANGSQLTLRAAPGGTHGTMRYSVVITDVTGAGHDDRRVTGTLTVEVLGLPGTPGRPSVTQTLSHTAVVAFTPPAPNGAPIDQLQVSDNHGGTHSCPASPCTIGGLRNGQTYTFTLRAHNVVGWGQPSAASGGVVPNQTPDIVTGVTATPGDTSASVRWATGHVDGSPITAYELLISPAPDSGPGIVTIGAPVTSTTVRGLANGTTYSFAVRARNTKGFGARSTPAQAVPFGTPVAPAAPSAGGADSADRSEKAISVSWTPPADNGNGRPITQYTITPYKSGTPQAPVAEGTALAATFTVPNDGKLWTYAVTATNSGGKTSAASPRSAPPVDASSTPAAMATPVAAVSDNAPNRATVKYVVPDEHGAQLTKIVVDSSPGGNTSCPLGAAGSTQTCSITGLTDGTSYTFTVHAVNKNGAGPESPSSNSVTPYLSPTPKASATANASGEDVNYTWSTPNGGDATISCRVTWTGGGSSNACSGSGSSTVSWSSTGKITVTVTGKAGPQTTTAQDTTGAQPKNPTVTLAWGDSAAGQPGCSSSDCHYVVINIKDFDNNATVAGSYQAETNSWATAKSFSIHTNGNGDGTYTDNSRYFGYKGTTFDIVIGGKTYHDNWP